MNIKKSILALAAAVLPFTAFAQNTSELSINFEDASQYKSIGAYDWWEKSPFRVQPGESAPRLSGNCLVVDNPDKQLDELTQVEANPSAKVLGFERSICGSNMYGARIELKTPYTLGTTTKYVHVKMLRPSDIEGRVMLIGLGKHNAQAVGATTTWKEQTEDIEQFTVIGNQKPTPGYWSDIVFPIKCAGNVDIYSLVVCVDCESPHRLSDDFLVYIDDIEINSTSRPSIALRGDYPVCFDKEVDQQTHGSRMYNNISVTTNAGTFIKKANGRMGLTEAFDNFIPVKRGSQVSITPGWTGNSMHSFVYFDANNDGRFDETDNKEFVGTRKNFNATHTFTIPANQVPGVYRIRTKVDWESTDPAGNADNSNFILANGGGMIDALLFVYDESTTVNVSNSGGLNGDIVQTDGQKINNLVHTRGTALPVKWLPETGFECAGMTLTVGNIGADAVHGNPQYINLPKVTYRQFDDDGNYTIPAELLYTDLNIEGEMVQTGRLPKPDFVPTSKDPIDGEFRASSRALTLKVKNGYMSTASGYTDGDGYLKLTNGTEPTDAKGYWVVCGDDENGYQIYNVEAGTGKVLGFTGSEAGARAKLYDVNSIPANVTTRFDYKASTSGTNPYKAAANRAPARAAADAPQLEVSDFNTTFRLHGSTNNCWNDRNDYLALWAADDAFGNNGSAIVVHDVEYDFGDGDVVTPVTPAEKTRYTIKLAEVDTDLYFTTTTVPDNNTTTYSIQTTPQEFYIEPTGTANVYTITGVNGDKVGLSTITNNTWDFANVAGATWTIADIEGGVTTIIKSGTVGFGVDVAEAGKGVYTNKPDGKAGVKYKWIVAPVVNNVEIVEVAGIKVMESLADGDFPGNTVWYTVKNYYNNNGTAQYYYLSTGEGYVNGSELVLNNQNKDNSDSGLWCFVKDGDNGYKVYNKAKGTGYVLNAPTSGNGAMVAAASASACDFTWQQGTNKAGTAGWFIKNGTSGTQYWNQQNNRLQHWDNAQAATDNNSTFIVEEYEEGLPATKLGIKLSNARQTNYYTIRNNNNPQNYAHFAGASSNLSLGTAKDASALFYFTEVPSESTSEWLAVNIHAFAAGDKTMNNWASWGEVSSPKTWYIRLATGTTGQANDYNICYTTANVDTQNTNTAWNHQSAGVLSWHAGDDRGSGWYLEPASLDDVTAEVYALTGGSRPAGVSKYTLWYDFPATKSGVSDPWMEYGLPIGNGKLGATLYGGVTQDEIQFNEKTLWEGGDVRPNHLRNEDRDGLIGWYQNFGSILVTDKSDAFSFLDATKPANGYVRYLDIESGVAGVDFTSAAGTHYTRRYIASKPDNTVVAHYAVSEGDETLDLNIAFAPGQRINASTPVYTNHGGSFGGKLTTIDYNAKFSVTTVGGTIEDTAEGIVVRGATEVNVFLAAGTNFDSTNASNVSGTRTDVENANAAALTAATAKDWDSLLSAHVSDFSSKMKRVELDLGGRSEATTKAVIDAYSNASPGENGLFLETLYFQYGRYLAISSNNINTIHAPSNLQGIWNNRACSDFWHCDVHADINVQMNYWPVESTNLSEMHMPFLNHIIDVSGDDRNFHARAQLYSNLNMGGKAVRGWLLPTETNIFGGGSNWEVPRMKSNSAWYCSHLWQHYRYTLDKDFLKKAFPTMVRAALCIKDMSIKNEQENFWYLQNEYSPEHGDAGHSTAYAQQHSAEGMDMVIKAAAALGSEVVAELGLTDEVAEITAFYPQIDKGIHFETYKGNECLREWYDEPLNWKGDNDASGHRHISHLMALFPYGQVSGFDTSDEGKRAFNAAVNSLRVRSSRQVTGWSGGHKANLYARALDGNAARDVYSIMLRHSGSYNVAMAGEGGLYYNLWDAHSPFQIDGNFGYTSSVAEMLLQSYDGTIHLLPALPTAWSEGSISGLKAVGNFTVDQAWAGGQLTGADITSNAGGELRVHYGDKVLTIENTLPGCTYHFDLVNGLLNYNSVDASIVTITDYIDGAQNGGAYAPAVLKQIEEVVLKKVKK